MPPKITGFSTALFSTWILVEDFGILFDAGDGVASGLLQKSRKAKTIAISHADRDHVTGILQLNQLNAGHGIERLIYPSGSGSFPALRDFCAKFDPETQNKFPWVPAKPGDRFEIGAGHSLKVVSNTHVYSDSIKSIGYQVIRTKRKLKPEFEHMNTSQIAKIGKERGRDATTDVVETVALSYAGDTGVEDALKWINTETLIHEATFIDPSDAESTRSRNQHSLLPTVLAMAVDASPQRLVLHHFSTRYDESRIVSEIRRLCAEAKVMFPVFAMLPGKISRDLLSGPPVFQP